MDAYTSFARVYDAFMDNIPYEEWGRYIRSLLEEYVSGKGWCWIWAAAPAA